MSEEREGSSLVQVRGLVNPERPITDEGVAVGGAFDSDTATGLIPIATASRLCDHSRDRDPSAGGEAHVRSIPNGCSPAGHDRATEVVAIGSAR